MDYFGINSAEDLPKIKEVLDLEVAEATAVNETLNVEESVIELPFEEEIIVREHEEESSDEPESDIVPGDEFSSENNS